VAPVIVDINGLAGDKHHGSDVVPEREKHPGVFCRVSHAVDHDIGALVKQLPEVLGGVAVGLDETNTRIPKIGRKAGLCPSARSHLPACAGQPDRSGAAHQPVSTKHDRSRHPGSVGQDGGISETEAEIYHGEPGQDMSEWETELAFKLAD
jgi:hypothetical protein